MSRQPLDFSLNLGIDNSRRKSVFDPWIVLSVFLLSLIGIFMIYSASQSVEMALRQGVYMIFGLAILLLVSFSNFRKMEVFYLYSYWPGLLLLIIVLFFSNENNETNRWIDLGIFTIQPSEKIEIKNIKNLEYIKQSLISVVESNTGTAKNIYDPKLRIAGKTGTAQVKSILDDNKYQEIRENVLLRDHALFVGYGPVEDPSILVVAIVENGESGSLVAAPLVKKAINLYQK